jgi:hypothetical protein
VQGFNDDMGLDDDSPLLPPSPTTARCPRTCSTTHPAPAAGRRALTSNPLFARAHSSGHPPHAVVLTLTSKILVVDVHGRRTYSQTDTHRTAQQSPRKILSKHGDLVCVSHGQGLACVLNLATGAVVADVGLLRAGPRTTRRT